MELFFRCNDYYGFSWGFCTLSIVDVTIYIFSVAINGELEGYIAGKGIETRGSKISYLYRTVAFSAILLPGLGMAK